MSTTTAETLVSSDHSDTKVSHSTPEKIISSAIKKAEVEIRKQYSFLAYQDLCGSLIFLFSLGVNIFGWWYYLKNPSSYYHCGFIVVIVALATSLLHELEHDLIHNLYFKKTPFLQDVMFFWIWVAKLHGNPWYRREMHLKHHILSGQKDDAEERLIGLGLPFGFTRLAVSLHPFGMLITTPAAAKDSAWLNVKKMNLSSAPVANIFFILTKLYLIYLGAMWIFSDSWVNYLPAQHWWWIRMANVCICLPNILRQACIQVMSNCSHYYGDIPEKSVFYQNQILDHPLLYPLQMFCFNFGATHIVHHYIPGQPFYIRELVYRRVKNLMIEQGVRINDFGSVFRANHYYENSEKKEIAKNNSNTSSMILSLFLLLTIGTVTFPIYDQWAFFCMVKRIIQKYIHGKEYRKEA